MRHRVLACDFDGTLATDGVCTDETVEALERVAASRYPARPGDRAHLGGARSTSSTRAVSSRRSWSRTAPWSSTPRAARSSCWRRACPRGLVAEFQRTGVHPAGGRPRALLDRLVSQDAEALGGDRQARRRPPGRPQPRLGDGAASRASASAPGSRRRCALIGELAERRPSPSATGRTTSRSSRSRACRSRSPTRSTRSRRAPTSCSPSRTARGSQSLAAALVAGDLGALTALSPLAG